MTIIEKIEAELRQLPPDKQSEVLDFAAFLRQQHAAPQAAGQSLRDHPAFGVWRNRGIDALAYQERLRAEWDSGTNGTGA